MCDLQAYTYVVWGLVITMVLINVFFIVRFIPIHMRLGRRSRKRVVLKEYRK